MLQGNQPAAGMTGVYDRPSVEAVLAEQEGRFPHGALGVLRPPMVAVLDLQREMDLVARWRRGEMGTIDLMQRLEALRVKNAPALVAGENAGRSRERV